MLNMFENIGARQRFYLGTYNGGQKTEMGNVIITLSDLTLFIPHSNNFVDKRPIPHDSMNFLIPRKFHRVRDKIAMIKKGQRIMIKLQEQERSGKFVVDNIDDDLRFY